MTNMKQKKLVFEEDIRSIMQRIGLFFDDVSIDDSIQTILTDSIMFITFIIELEQEFEIEIPDEYLIPERIGTLRQLDSILIELVPVKKPLSEWALIIRNKIRSLFIRSNK